MCKGLEKGMKLLCKIDFVLKYFGDYKATTVNLFRAKQFHEKYIQHEKSAYIFLSGMINYKKCQG